MLSPQQSFVSKAHVSAVTDDHMVEQVDPHKGCNALEPTGQIDVVGARARITARVVVHEDDRRRALPNGRLEDFSRVDDARREASFGDLDLPELAVLHIEQYHVELFLFFGPKPLVIMLKGAGSLVLLPNGTGSSVLMQKGPGAFVLMSKSI